MARESCVDLKGSRRRRRRTEKKHGYIRGRESVAGPVVSHTRAHKEFEKKKRDTDARRVVLGERARPCPTLGPVPVQRRAIIWVVRIGAIPRVHDVRPAHTRESFSSSSHHVTWIFSGGSADSYFNAGFVSDIRAITSTAHTDNTSSRDVSRSPSQLRKDFQLSLAASGALTEPFTIRHFSEGPLQCQTVR